MSSDESVYQICEALAQLRGARDRLKKAGCKQATDAVRRAIKSTEGALRHAMGGSLPASYSPSTRRAVDRVTEMSHYERAITGMDEKARDALCKAIGERPDAEPAFLIPQAE